MHQRPSLEQGRTLTPRCPCCRRLPLPACLPSSAAHSTLAPPCNPARPLAELYKSFVTKKISDAITDVNKAGGIATGLITKSGNKFSVHDKSLRGFIANLKTYLAAEAQSNVSSAIPYCMCVYKCVMCLTGCCNIGAGVDCAAPHAESADEKPGPWMCQLMPA